ncbi:MAG: hypothetical protein GY697_00960, partial [Desulfobacterales bacterium]|nr:hypothetical protein [Desulfobacterales bacterium]
ESAWFVTEYDFKMGLVEMIKHTPGETFVKLNIALETVSARTTRAAITYSHTALGAAGDKVIEAFTEESYTAMMQAWEKAMNHYLKTGEMLTGLDDF